MAGSTDGAFTPESGNSIGTALIRRALSAAAAWVWPVCAVLVPLWPHRGVFATSQLFFVRDLGSYFWPHHLWLRRTVAAGESPFWDPNPGLGYATVADPALQIFFVLTLPFRLLLPEVVGFNVSVALPFPVAGLGLYLLLRRVASAPAACLGAIFYAAGGPIVSTANCTNLAWCAALTPWCLLLVDRLHEHLSRHTIALLASVLACTFLAGEPVTFAGATALTLAAACCAPHRREAPRRNVVTAVLAAILLSVGLAAVQVLPLIDATGRSIRGAGLLLDGWSLDPVRLIETVAPYFFGNYLAPAAEVGPWLSVVNGGREPYLISLYLGVPLVLLALAGAVRGARGPARYWGAVGVLSLIISFGDHTPFMRLMRDLLPELRTFRYPTKFVVFAALAFAMLAALGWDAVARARDAHSRLRPSIMTGAAVGAIALAALIIVRGAPAVAASWADAAVRAAGVANPAAGRSFLIDSVAAHAPRLLFVAVGTLALLVMAMTSRVGARRAPHALAVLATLDLLAVNGGLNPTLNATALAAPDWISVTREHSGDRVFISRDFLMAGPGDPDLPPSPPFRPDVPITETVARYHAVLPGFPTAWDVKEAIAEELTGLRPREYLELYELYAAGEQVQRTRLLQRLGVRYHVVPRPPAPDARLRHPLVELPPLGLYELGPAAPRFEVVTDVRIGGSPQAQIGALVEASPRAGSLLVVEAQPRAAGHVGEPRAPGVVLLSESTTRLELDVAVPASGGYLLCRDAFDPGWRAEVDGEPADIVRANRLLRAVRLVAGSHRVVLWYSPQSLRWGVLISAVSAVVIVAIAFLSRSSGRPSHERRSHQENH